MIDYALIMWTKYACLILDSLFVYFWFFIAKWNVKSGIKSFRYYLDNDCYFEHKLQNMNYLQWYKDIYVFN